MYIIKSDFRGVYVKTGSTDTPELEDAKVFKTRKAADRFKQSYLTADYEVIKLKEKKEGK